MTTVKQIVDECGDVARERWRFYYEKSIDGHGDVGRAAADADYCVTAEYDRGVLVQSKKVAAIRHACVIAEGVFMHASDTGEIDRDVMAKFVADFAKIKRDLP